MIGKESKMPQIVIMAMQLTGSLLNGKVEFGLTRQRIQSAFYELNLQILA